MAGTAYQLKLIAPDDLTHQIPLSAVLFDEIIRLTYLDFYSPITKEENEHLLRLQNQIGSLETRMLKNGQFPDVLIVPITDYSLDIPKTACYAVLGKCF